MTLMYIIAVAFIIIGLLSQFQHYIKNKKSGYIETIGEVIDHRTGNPEEIEENENGLNYQIIEFHANNKNYRLVSGIGIRKKKGLGKKVKVKYNPEDPTKAIIVNDFSGLVMVIIGIIILLLTKTI